MIKAVLIALLSTSTVQSAKLVEHDLSSTSEAQMEITSPHELIQSLKNDKHAIGGLDALQKDFGKVKVNTIPNQKTKDVAAVKPVAKVTAVKPAVAEPAQVSQVTSKAKATQTGKAKATATLPPPPMTVEGAKAAPHEGDKKLAKWGSQADTPEGRAPLKPPIAQVTHTGSDAQNKDIYFEKKAGAPEYKSPATSLYKDKNMKKDKMGEMEQEIREMKAAGFKDDGPVYKNPPVSAIKDDKRAPEITKVAPPNPDKTVVKGQEPGQQPAKSPIQPVQQPEKPSNPVQQPGQPIQQPGQPIQKAEQPKAPNAPNTPNAPAAPAAPAAAPYVQPWYNEPPKVPVVNATKPNITKEEEKKKEEPPAQVNHPPPPKKKREWL